MNEFTRVLTTLILVGTFLLAGRVRVPGIDILETQNSSFNLRVTSLGIQPFVTAFLYVELLSLVFRRYRLRWGGIAGRRKLTRFAMYLGVGFSLIQGAGIAIARQRQGLVPNPGMMFVLSTVMTLAAGATFALLVVHLISRWGIGNGYCLMILLTVIPAYLNLVFANRGLIFLNIVAVALAVGVFVRRQPTLFIDSEKKEIPVNLPPFPQSISAIDASDSLLGMLSVPWGMLVIAGAAVLIPTFSFVGFHLFSSRPRLQRNVPFGLVPLGNEITSHRWLLPSTAVLLILGAALPAAGWLMGLRPSLFDALVAVMLVAWAFDIVAEWRFRGRHGDEVVSILQMDNVYCACTLQGILERGGLHSLIRGFQFRSLFFLFQPIVKMELLVPATEMDEARKLIRPELIEIV
jgi:SecY